MLESYFSKYETKVLKSPPDFAFFKMSFILVIERYVLYKENILILKWEKK